MGSKKQTNAEEIINSRAQPQVGARPPQTQTKESTTGSLNRRAMHRANRTFSRCGWKKQGDSSTSETSRPQAGVCGPRQVHCRFQEVVLPGLLASPAAHSVLLWLGGSFAAAPRSWFFIFAPGIQSLSHERFRVHETQGHSATNISALAGRLRHDFSESHMAPAI